MSTSAASGIGIVGVGHHLPEQVEDNATLCRQLTVSPDWIVEKTGIQRRRLAAPGDSASGYAGAAARKALAMAGVKASEVDIVVACTFSGDYVFPPLSAKLHQDLGVRGGQIFDIQANCSGIVTGLTAASDRMRSDDELRHALVVGVELCSRFVERGDVNTSIYLSDGAGAIVLGRCESDGGIRASAFHTDSSNYESVRLRGGGSSHPLLGRAYDAAVDAMEMNGLATWKQAITHLPQVVRKACGRAGVDVAAVDCLVFHQANLRLIEYIVRKMGLDMRRTFTNVQEIGNTGSASIAIALSEAVEHGAIRPDDIVVLAGVGAGFNFGASVWRWLPGMPAGS